MEVSGKLAGIKHDLQFCEHCQFENVTSEANGVCHECREYMCNMCFRQHLKGKRNRNHSMIDINDPDIVAKKCTEEVDKCKQHDNEAIKFYCRKHEMVGCGDCMVLGHGTCQPEYIKDLSQNIHENEDFINLKRKVEQMELENKASHKNVEKSRHDCKAIHEKVLAEIRTFRTDINKYLDEAESAIISEMKQLLLDNDKRIDQLDNECAKYLSDIETLKQKLDTTVQRENVLFIQTVRSKESVQEIEHELSKTVQSIRNVKHYEFVPNQQLASIITSRGKLGQLNFSSFNEPQSAEITTLENNADTFTFMEPKMPLQQDTDIKAGVKPPPAVVGSRVKANDQSIFEQFMSHGGKPGTVTVVHPDGTVTVYWDATRVTRSGFRVGTGRNDITLI